MSIAEKMIPVKEIRINKRQGFTLVEIMIVVAIIALLARKRSQAGRILNDLRMIDSAVDQYAIENGKSTGDPVATADWTSYVKKGTRLYETGTDLSVIITTRKP